MAHALFKRLTNPPTPAELAIQFAKNDLEDYIVTRQTLPEGSPEPPENIERLKRLAVLMKGPHGAHIRPLVEKAFPSVRPVEGHA